MKIRQICMLVLLCLGVIPAVQAQSFDKLWKEVEQAGKKTELQSHHCRSKQKCRGAFYPFHGATSFAASSKIE